MLQQSFLLCSFQKHDYKSKAHLTRLFPAGFILLAFVLVSVIPDKLGETGICSITEKCFDVVAELHKNH